jgi:hypothetical protein
MTTKLGHAKRTSEITTAPVEVPAVNVALPHAPEFLRLPPPGQLCQWTGLSRSAINELILGTPRNNFKPPVRSFCLRKKGAATGIRLVHYQSLRQHILSNEEKSKGAVRS